LPVFPAFARLFDIHNEETGGQVRRMTKLIRVAFLEKAQLAQAAALLGTAFNESAKVMRGELAESFSADPYRPVVLAATEGDKLVGVIECDTGPEFEQRNIYAFSKLAIDPAHRGKGIGQQLVQAAETFVSNAWMKGEPGTVAVIDGTKLDNPKSKFYENMDYAADWPPVLRDGQPILKKKLNVGFCPV